MKTRSQNLLEMASNLACKELTRGTEGMGPHIVEDETL